MSWILITSEGNGMKSSSSAYAMVMSRIVKIETHP